jgi:hypothetical protein
MTSHPQAAGSGPLYEHTPAGEQAAAENVTIPGSSASSDDQSDNPDGPDHPTGEGQAAVNRANDPPS